MNATWDQDSNAFYFGPTDKCVARTVDLGSRQVLVDIDHNGQIIGVEVI